MDMPHQLTAAERLRILRKKARLRGERLPDYPDLPEDVAERAEEAEGWQQLQAETAAWQAR